jgi:hypothetical protein
MEQTNPLELVFAINEALDYEIDDRQIVTIRYKQDHWIQRLARKVRFRIPEYRRISMDAYGSFVFQCIDGKRPVKDIGELMMEKFGEEANPVYERLLVFLNHIEKHEHFILKVTDTH